MDFLLAPKPESSLHGLDNRLGVLGLDEYADPMLYGVEWPNREPLYGEYGSRDDMRAGESIGVPGREFD